MTYLDKGVHERIPLFPLFFKHPLVLGSFAIYNSIKHVPASDVCTGGTK